MSQTGPAGIGIDADDAAVIEQSQEHPDSFGIIFDRHAPYIHRYLTRRLGPDVADDLTAETFLVAFRRRSRYDSAAATARPWLYGIATNLIRQHRRDDARRLRTLHAVASNSVEAVATDGTTSILTAQAARPALAAALAQLPPSDRDVLLLIAWEELTYEEVATALEIPVGTVRSRLNRVRRRVRPMLDTRAWTKERDGHV